MKLLISVLLSFVETIYHLGSVHLYNCSLTLLIIICFRFSCSKKSKKITAICGILHKVSSEMELVNVYEYTFF